MLSFVFLPAARLICEFLKVIVVAIARSVRFEVGADELRWKSCMKKADERWCEKMYNTIADDAKV